MCQVTACAAERPLHRLGKGNHCRITWSDGATSNQRLRIQFGATYSAAARIAGAVLPVRSIRIACAVHLDLRSWFVTMNRKGSPVTMIGAANSGRTATGRDLEQTFRRPFSLAKTAWGSILRDSGQRRVAPTPPQRRWLASSGAFNLENF